MIKASGFASDTQMTNLILITAGIAALILVSAVGITDLIKEQNSYLKSLDSKAK